MEDNNLNIMMAVLTNGVRHSELASFLFTKSPSTLDALMARVKSYMNVERPRTREEKARSSSTMIATTKEESTLGPTSPWEEREKNTPPFNPPQSGRPLSFHGWIAPKCSSITHSYVDRRNSVKGSSTLHEVPP